MDEDELHLVSGTLEVDYFTLCLPLMSGNSQILIKASVPWCHDHTNYTQCIMLTPSCTKGGRLGTESID
jgi:hypothetical protein